MKTFILPSSCKLPFLGNKIVTVQCNWASRLKIYIHRPTLAVSYVQSFQIFSQPTLLSGGFYVSCSLQHLSA